VHAKREFPDFTCTSFSSPACEKRISGFDMHKLFQAVHVKREFPDFTCTSFSSRACEKKISGFDMHKLFKLCM
jgi:hypothetical protein